MNKLGFMAVRFRSVKCDKCKHVCLSHRKLAGTSALFYFLSTSLFIVPYITNGNNFAFGFCNGQAWMVLSCCCLVCLESFKQNRRRGISLTLTLSLDVGVPTLAESFEVTFK